MSTPATIRIATRASRLALWQSEHVAATLRDGNPGLAVELVPMTTTGDRIIDRPLADIGGKGLFIKELEVAMREGRADLAVHSMKDVPFELPGGFDLAVILPRDDPRDALVSPAGSTLAALGRGSRVGTSSLRRRSQLLASRPDLVVEDLRGNVPTRLERLAEGRFDAIVLATAGLSRLALLDQRCRSLGLDEMLPAVGQGAIGVECRADDRALHDLLAPLGCAITTAAVTAERAMNATLGGSCHVPIAGHARLDGDTLSLAGLVASVDGAKLVRHTASGSAADAAALGREVGAALLKAGADRILRALN